MPNPRTVGPVKGSRKSQIGSVNPGEPLEVSLARGRREAEITSTTLPVSGDWTSEIGTQPTDDSLL